LAHQKVIQRPIYIGDCWAPIFCKLKKYEPFTNPERIAEFLTTKTPSARKVARLIKCTETEQWRSEKMPGFPREIYTIVGLACAWHLPKVYHSKRYLGWQHSSIVYFDRWFWPQAHCPHLWPSFRTAMHISVFYGLAEEFSALLREKGAWGFNYQNTISIPYHRRPFQKRPAWASIRSLSEATHDWVVCNSPKCAFTLLT